MHITPILLNFTAFNFDVRRSSQGFGWGPGIAGLLIALFACCSIELHAASEPAVPPVRYWQLSSGSRIAYLHFPAAEENAIALISLHGGHLISLDQPEAYRDAIKSFLLGLGSAQAPRKPSALSAPAPEPVLFGGGAVKGSSPAFSPDGTTVYTHLHSGENRRHTILVSHFRDGRWTPSETASFSGTFDDMEPAFSADGKRLLFASERPLAGKRIGMQIWFVQQTPAGWSEPCLVGGPIAQLPSESGVPSLARDGSLTFARITDKGWPWETILQSRCEDGIYTEPVQLNDAVNPGGRSWSHTIAPDQSFLIYAGVIDSQTPRADSLGDIDLYVSFRVNGKWQRGVNLGPVVNTSGAEVWPRISRDGRHLFFNRQGLNERGIHRVELEPLLAPLRGWPVSSP